MKLLSFNSSTLMLREVDQLLLYIREMDVVQEVRYAARLSTPE